MSFFILLELDKPRPLLLTLKQSSELLENQITAKCQATAGFFKLHGRAAVGFGEYSSQWHRILIVQEQTLVVFLPSASAITMAL